MDFMKKIFTGKSKDTSEQQGEEKIQQKPLMVHVDDKYITIIPDKNQINLDSSLKINRENIAIQENKHFKVEKNIQEIHFFEAFLGIIKVLEMEFLLFVESSKLVCEIQGDKIYEIDDVAFICIKNDENKVSKKSKVFRQGVRELLKECHYYSYTYPLTVRLENQLFQNMVIDTRYQWNQKMHSNYMSSVSSQWKIQMIQGFVGSFQSELNGNQLNLYLISRRSQYRGGTRYNHRGSDTDGNPANFVESEQIVQFKGRLSSYIIIRGSVPLLWEQKGNDQRLKMYKSQEMSSQAFKKHYNDMKEQYSRIISVNLMKRTDQQEKILVDAYESELENQPLHFLTYEYFDFNSNKNQLNSVTNAYRSGLTQDLDHLFIGENETGESQQKGVFRINCKDCLDRTNTYMMKIALTSLEHILASHYKIILEKEVGGNPLSQMDSPQTHQLLKQFKYLWAESGDNISLLYAGTDAATTRLTKKGYAGFSNQFRHKMTCANVGFKRLIQSQFQDAHKQECFDILAGNHSKSSLTLPFEVREQLMKESAVYNKQKLSIYTVSLNIQASTMIQDNVVLPDFFKFSVDDLPDFLVISLQEIVNFKMFKLHNEKAVQKWLNIIQHNISLVNNGQQTYDLVDRNDMSGNLLLVYAKKSICDQISDIYHDCIKVGVVDNLSKYGAPIIHLKYADSTICFIGCYLPSGRKKQSQRKDALKYIHKKGFQKQGVGKYKKMNIEDHDLVILLGDFNFRIDNEFSKVNDIILKSNEENKLQAIQKLLKNDELELLRQKETKILMQYKEPKIEFFPSFNDSSKKQRTSSWRNRVLYQNQNNDSLSIDPYTIVYNSCPNYFYKKQVGTDHIPVYCRMGMTINQIDQEKSAQILEKLMKERHLLGSTIEEEQNEDQDQQQQIQQQQNIMENLKEENTFNDENVRNSYQANVTPQ